MFSEVLILFQKEIRLEWRQKYAISSILLYVLATIFVVYVAFDEIKLQLWNGLFWIVTLFSAINAVAKSFVQERSNRYLYYYSLTDPLAVLWSKMLYNFLLLLLLQALIFVLLSFIAGAVVVDIAVFGIGMLLSSLALSIILTFVAGIASRTHNVAIFMAILSFPLLIPVILLMVPVSASALGLEGSSLQDSRMIGVAAIDLLLLALSGVLFPFLWTE